MIVMSLVVQVDKSMHGFGVKVVDVAAFDALAQRRLRVQVECHYLPPTLHHFAVQLSTLYGVADVHELFGVEVHSCSPHRDSVGDLQFHESRTRDVSFDLLEALGRVLRVLRVEVSSCHAAGIAPFVVEHHRRDTV